RTRLHAVAFEVLARVRLDSEAAEHAIRAELVGNSEAAQLLERVGRAALRSGAVATARTCLATAIRYAQEHAPPDLVMALAEAAFADDDPSEALRVYERVLAVPELPVALRTEALRMSGRALDRTGAHAEAVVRFDRAAALAGADDPASAVGAIASQAYALVTHVGPGAAMPLVTRARDLAELAGEAQRPLLRQVTAAMWGYFALLMGDASGLGGCMRAVKQTAVGTGSQ